MTVQAPEIALTRSELQRITGYRRPAEQLVELHRRGFHRAHRDRSGQVVLERAHYEAVCRGASSQATAAGPRWSKAA